MGKKIKTPGEFKLTKKVNKNQGKTIVGNKLRNAKSYNKQKMLEFFRKMTEKKK